MRKKLNTGARVCIIFLNLHGPDIFYFSFSLMEIKKKTWSAFRLGAYPCPYKMTTKKNLPFFFFF